MYTHMCTYEVNVISHVTLVTVHIFDIYTCMFHSTGTVVYLYVSLEYTHNSNIKSLIETVTK